MAEFAASAAQGHIGRAKYLATNEEARKTREKILNIPSTVKDLASAFVAANTFLELAKEQAKVESETRDEVELTKLKESYGTIGSRLATGGSKAVKELEKDQKSRASRLVKNFLDLASLDIETQIRDEVIKNVKDQNNSAKYLEKLRSLEEFRNKIDSNGSIQLAIESLFCELR
jgi:DNA polymerase-3 subunit delta'